MGNKKYEEKTAELAQKVISKIGNDIELIDVEYVKEGGTFYLRVFIDKPGGIDINDCVKVTEPMNELLDKENFISDAYIFEVSSPGLTRPLKKDNDFKRNIDKKLEIKLFTANEIIGCKEFEGILRSFDDKKIKIETDKGVIEVIRSDIALCRLAIEF